MLYGYCNSFIWCVNLVYADVTRQFYINGNIICQERSVTEFCYGALHATSSIWFDLYLDTIGLKQVYIGSLSSLNHLHAATNLEMIKFNEIFCFTGYGKLMFSYDV